MKRIFASLLLLSVAACNSSDVKSTLGLKKHSPDEFMVMSRPALTVPPQFDLPAPVDAGITPPKDFSSNKAKQALFGTATPTTSKNNTAENALLAKAGAANTKDNIRQLIEEDERAAQNIPANAEEEPGFFKRMFKPITLDEKPDPIVNPQAEKDRIKEDQAQGTQVDGSQTPTIQPKGESVLDKIF